MRKVHLFLLFALSPCLLFSQQATLSGGGEASGAGGSMSYSIGQVDYLYKEAGSSTSEGIQQTQQAVLLTSIYVDHTATGTNDGRSWENAFTDLQDALAMGENLSIHIAQGTYKPTSGTQRGISFDFSSNQNIYGGYPNGGGTRDAESNLTTLSGEVDDIPGYDGNSFHVVKIVNAMNVLVDGLDIKDGNANDSGTFGRARGGGIFCNNARVTLRNITLRRNRAIYGGGVFATLSPNVTIESSNIKLNQADYGSALYHSNETMMYIQSSRIVDNNSLVRCAIEINNSLYTKIENSVIANNDSSNANAIAFIATNRDQSCDITNTTIIGEVANKLLLTFQIGFNDVLDVTINNSIIAHQNINHDKNVKEFNNGILNFNHNNCYFQGSTVIGNGTNTLFSAVAGDLLLNPDYSVNECSPVVNAGENGYSTAFTDIDGNNRFFNTIDIGAYESQTVCPPTREMGDLVELDESTKAQDIKIFPNPTSGALQIQSSVENLTMHIFDVVGKTIIRTTDKRIDISNFPAGTYFIRVESNGTVLRIEKIMKN